ncbi:hypothetical protein CHU98_g1243 [Xylaria longipes]|nr:hypothetical protein CHU98_g1243 [Xylaria longipes]
MTRASFHDRSMAMPHTIYVPDVAADAAVARLNGSPQQVQLIGTNTISMSSTPRARLLLVGSCADQGELRPRTTRFACSQHQQMVVLALQHGPSSYCVLNMSYIRLRWKIHRLVDDDS